MWINLYVPDPNLRAVTVRVSSTQAGESRVEFTPNEVGGYLITVQYGGQNVVGCPFTCNTYDASRIKIIDIDHTGSSGKEMGFTGNVQFSSKNKSRMFCICG